MSRRVSLLLAVLAIGVVTGVCVERSVCGRATFAATASEDAISITVHFIDVDQGDSILIDTPNKDVLIDGGPTSAGSKVLDYLDSLNISRIHLMVATHPHEDHIGGLVNVLDSATSVDEILINNQTYTSDTYTDFMNLTQGHNVTVAERGYSFSLTGTVNFTVFNPVQPLEFTNTNDNSIVVKLQVGNTSFLFMGDAEEYAEQSMLVAGLDLQSDVLKVGHHGSSSSTTQPFLDEVAPSYAIISAGEGNRFGHPHNETVQRLLVPEFHPSMLLPIFMMATLLAIILYRRIRSF